MSFENEVIRRTQNMIEALDEGTETDLLKAAKLGCAAMTYLIDESSFREAPDRLNELINDKSLIDFFSDEDKFEDFLRVERKVLEKSGLDCWLVEQIIDNCSKARQHFIESGEIKKFWHTLEAVKFRACDAERILRTQIGNSETEYEIRTEIRGTAMALTGGIVYAINKTLDVTIIPIFSPLSELVGSSIFGIGLGKFMEPPPYA